MNRTRGHAGGGSNLHVVLGESAQSRSLRDILDRAGFDVVGQASTPGDLLRLLAVMEPDVIVLDAEVSATAALSVRDLAPMAGIVVVWPAAVSSSVADRQVTPARAAFDLPEAVRRAKRPQEARVAILAPVPAMTEPAQVVYLPRPRARRRIREHTFGLVAASFIIAVAALGLVRTAIDNPGDLRGERVQTPTVEPSQPPGTDNGENQEPQEPPNVSEREPLGPVELLSNAQPAPKAAQSPPDEQTPPKDDGPGGDDPDDGEGPTEEPTGHHGGDFNGYDNPREHLVGSHRRDTSTNSGHPTDWQRNGGVGHAVHGADGKSG